jgi:curved DNA-binding protein CbpA
MDAVFPQVTDPAAGMVALDPLCPALFSRLKVEEAFVGLPDAIGDGCNVEEIFRQVPDGSGNLVKLLWFLEAAGLLHRQGRPQDPSIDAQLNAIAEAPPPKASKTAQAAQAPKPPAPPKKSQNEPTEEAASAESGDGQKKRRPPMTDDQLRAAHRKRIGLDFYAFIGVPPRAPKQAIDRKCKGLARRWRIPGKHRTLPEDVNAKVDDLLAGVQLVWRTLTDDTHREEYDKRMGQGRAPKVGDLRVASAASVQTGGGQSNDKNTGRDEQHSKARQLMDKGDFKSALSLLKKARVDDPSSPDIMADLGWATWNIQGGKNGDAEEFLRLALTFDSNHLAGLEYLAKVLVEQRELETATILLQRLVKLNPKSQWARKALANIDKGAK